MPRFSNEPDDMRMFDDVPGSPYCPDPNDEPEEDDDNDLELEEYYDDCEDADKLKQKRK